MTFSSLQQYIIMKCWGGQKIDRKFFADFYANKKIDGQLSPSAREGDKGEREKTKIITKSLERLIDKGIMIGYGVRTPKKWFIKEVKITKFGKKMWEKWQKRKQAKLKL